MALTKPCQKVAAAAVVVVEAAAVQQLPSRCDEYPTHVFIVVV